MALVVVIDSDASSALKGQMPDHAVWGGAVRFWLPGDVLSSPPFRHRVLSRERIEGPAIRLAQAAARVLAPISAHHRRPPGWVLAAETGTHEGSAEDLRRELDDLRDTVERQERETEERVFQLQVDLDEYVEQIQELERYRRELRALRGRLEEEGRGDLLGCVLPVGEEAWPDSCDDILEAVAAAQQHLSEFLVVPDEACRELDELCAAVEARAWGVTTWRGLRALACYARDKRDCSFTAGGFWEWSANSGNPYSWTASDKKLAMSGSETVRNNTKFWQARHLPIDHALEPSGRLHMEAHLKIAQGGGHDVPRVYFHDDTGGVTGKIHIGFLGPHRLVPNGRA